MKLRKLTLTAVLTAAALVMFVLENQLPPLTAIPGIKPGLSNIFTLFAMQALGPGWALGVLLVRVTLGCVIADKDVHIRRGGTLIGHESYPLAVSKGSIV